MGIFNKNKNVTTGKDGNLYFGKGTEGGRAPDVNKIRNQSQAAKNIADLIEQENAAEAHLEQIRLQKQAIFEEIDAEQKRIEEEILEQARQAQISKEETAQIFREQTVKHLTPKQLNPNDNPYRVALLQLVDGGMKKVYCDRPDWRACPQHGSASPFITNPDGTRYIPEYLKPNGAKTPREKTLAEVHNNFPDWVGDYLQPLNPENKGQFSGSAGRYEKWEQAEFGMIPSIVRKKLGVPTYLKISGKLREDTRFNLDIETKVKIDDDGNAVIYTFYYSPENVKGKGNVKSSFEISTFVPKDRINETGMKAGIKEHYDSVLARSSQINNILVKAWRNGEEVDIYSEQTVYDPQNPEHRKTRPSYWEQNRES